MDIHNTSHEYICGTARIEPIFLQTPHRFIRNRSHTREFHEGTSMNYFPLDYSHSRYHHCALFLWYLSPRNSAERLVQFSHQVHEDDVTAPDRLSYQSPTW